MNYTALQAESSSDTAPSHTALYCIAMDSTWLLKVNYKRIRVGFVLVSLDLISNVENVILGTFSKTLEVSTV